MGGGVPARLAVAVRRRSDHVGLWITLLACGRTLLWTVWMGLALYFASVGAGRLLWPLLANLMRLAIAAGGGWLALSWSGDLSHVFLALSAAFVVFGLMNVVAVAGGAWFGRVSSPLATLLPKRS